MVLISGPISEGTDKRATAMDDPAALAKEFDTAWRAGDSDRADAIAAKFGHQREVAASVVKQLVATLDKPVHDLASNGNPYGVQSALKQILESFGPPAATALAEMIASGNAPLSRTFRKQKMLDSEPVPTFWNSRYGFAIDVFARLGLEGQPAVRRLTLLLDSPSAETRMTVCECLQPIGPLASAALPKIRRLCHDKDPGCRREALDALVALDVDTNEVVPFLASALADPSPAVRNQALESIAVLGARVASLSDPLTSLLIKIDLDAKTGRDEEDHDPRAYAGGFINPEAVLRALRNVGLHDPRECDLIANLLIKSGPTMPSDWRDQLGSLLSAAGKMAHPAIARWVSAARDTDDAAEIAAVGTALRVRPQITELLPTLFARTAYFEGKYIEKVKYPWAWLISAGFPRKKSPLELGALSLVGPLTRIDPGPGASMELMDDDYIVYLVERGHTVGATQLGRAIQREIADLRGDTTEADRYAPASALWSRRSTAAEWLGNRGRNATVAVPALQSIIENFKYAGEKTDEEEYKLVRTCYVALTRITGNPESWMKDAERRLLAPMLAEPRRWVGYLMNYTDMMADIYALESPRLQQLMNGLDADLAVAAVNTIYFRTDDPELAATVLPQFLKRHSREELKKDLYWLECLPMAGSGGVVALDRLISILDEYLPLFQAAKFSTFDSGSAMTASVVSENGTVTQVPNLGPLLGTLAALRSIGGEEARRAVPALLAIYAEAPLGHRFRTEIIATLKSIEVDLGPVAKRWPPRLMTASQTSGDLLENIRELREFGPLAVPVLPELIRRLRRPNLGEEFSRVAIRALEAIAPADAHLKPLSHLALVNQSSVEMEERRWRRYSERP